jgi:hypothetical protein
MMRIPTKNSTYWQLQNTFFISFSVLYLVRGKKQISYIFVSLYHTVMCRKSGRERERERERETVYARVCVCVCVCVEERGSQWVWVSVRVTPSKGGVATNSQIRPLDEEEVPFQKHVKVFKRKWWSSSPMGVERKSYYAGEGQQQFNQLTDRSTSHVVHRAITEQNMVMRPVRLGTKNHCAGEDRQRSLHRILEITCSLNIPHWILI